MAFDRAAHRAQAARLVAHAAGGEVLLRWNGQGEAMPATIQRDQPKATQVNPDVGAQSLELITIAREARSAAGDLIFAAGRFPREGQHFTDASGRIYRIQEDRSISHAAILVYACATA